MLSRFGNDVAYFHFFNQLMFLVYVLSCFRPVLLFVTLRTIALQALLSMGILQARILEWVAVPSSRGSSWSRDRTCVSCIGRQILYLWVTGGCFLLRHKNISKVNLGLALLVKNQPANAGDIRDRGLIPRLGRSPGGGHGNSLQYSCLENPMDRGAWRATAIGSQRGGHNWSNLELHSS